MLPIRGVFEVVVPVKDLDRAESFYCDVLGLAVGLRDEARRWLFLRVAADAGMVVLQEAAEGGAKTHFAFAVDASELDRATVMLVEAGFEVDGPIDIDWMPARAIYFSDPDGHQLELCAVLEK